MSLDDTIIGFGRFWYDIIPIEDKVNLAKAALQIINQVYLAKRKQDVNFNQKDPFDIALELIAMKDDASYKQSFLLSIQLICAEILGIIEGSCPILFTSKQEEQTPHTLVKVHENANYDFEFVNKNSCLGFVCLFYSSFLLFSCHILLLLKISQSKTICSQTNFDFLALAQKLWD